jgi:hypothetical protein
MYLTGLTVCVDFSDFLERCLDNLKLLDRWVVVSVERDRATRRLCRKAGLDLLITKRLYEDGAPFNKGRAINDGLDVIGHHGWIVILDADTLLPEHFRGELESRQLQDGVLYGCPQRLVDIAGSVNLRTEGPWRKYPDNPVLGFMQIFSGARGARYPEHYPTAAKSDLEFNAQFERCEYIDSLITTHYGRRRFHHEGRRRPPGQS